MIDTTGYEVLLSPPADNPTIALDDDHNAAYDRYLSMHKVLVGRRVAGQLLELCAELQDATTPDHLVAAGWAATEAALVLGQTDDELREGFLNTALGSWKTAISYQKWINAQPGHWLADAALPFRTAQDIAVLPIFTDILSGGVKNKTVRNVFEDCLNIAQMNGVQSHLAHTEGDLQALREHNGYGYEANALLAVNRRLSGRWFALPASARSDSGVYHGEQTHDIIVVHQERGKILGITPIEVKGTVARRHKQRYKSLLVRGKMHLAGPGKHKPESTLGAIAAVYEGVASAEETALADQVTRRMMSMVSDYRRGARLGGVASPRSATAFRDNSRVVRLHPGLKM